MHLVSAQALQNGVRRTLAVLGFLQAPAQLLARLYVGSVFFRAGLSKLRDWDITLALFQDEYHVPWLPPEAAAVAGTTGELVLPVLLVLGLAGRVAAAGLSVVNMVAVLSLAELSTAALQQHQFWGSLLIGLLLWGPGRWAVDAWLAPHLGLLPQTSETACRSLLDRGLTRKV